MIKIAIFVCPYYSNTDRFIDVLHKIMAVLTNNGAIPTEILIGDDKKTYLNKAAIEYADEVDFDIKIAVPTIKTTNKYAMRADIANYLTDIADITLIFQSIFSDMQYEITAAATVGRPMHVVNLDFLWLHAS